MSTTKEKKVLVKEFDSRYRNPAMRLHLEEQGWKYIGENDGKIIFKIIY